MAISKFHKLFANKFDLKSTELTIYLKSFYGRDLSRKKQEGDSTALRVN